MARIRTIKPDFFKHEVLADLPMSDRLLFVGLWTLADCEGKLEDRPKRIKAEVFPYDTLNIEELLTRLQNSGFIIRYEVEELKVIIIPSFRKHQKLQTKEIQSGSKLPNPCISTGTPPEDEWDDTGTPPEHFEDEHETPPEHFEDEHETPPEVQERKRKGKGKEGNGDGETSSPEDSKKNNPPKPEKKEPPPSSAPPPLLFIQLPWQSENFKMQWDFWKDYKKREFKFCYKTEQSEQAALNELTNLSKGIEEIAIQIIHQSMAKGWKGFFELKNQPQFQYATSNTPRQETGFNADHKRDLAQRMAKYAGTAANNNDGNRQG